MIPGCHCAGTGAKPGRYCGIGTAGAGMVARIGKKNTFLIGALLGTAVICCSSGFPSGHCRWRWLVGHRINWPGRYHDRDVGTGSDTVEYGEYLTGVRIEGLTYYYSHLPVNAVRQSEVQFLPLFGIKRIYRQSGANAGSYYGHRTSIALVPCGFMLLAFVIICFIRSRIKNSKKSLLKLIIVKSAAAINQRYH